MIHFMKDKGEVPKYGDFDSKWESPESGHGNG
jgi:hypothetical protein